MRADDPSVQYDTPRPESRRGAFAARAPSSRCHVHFVAPAAASAATTVRVAPVAKYRTPSTMIGVVSLLNSGGVCPVDSDFHVHATASDATFARVSASSGEYRVLARSR